MEKVSQLAKNATGLAKFFHILWVISILIFTFAFCIGALDNGDVIGSIAMLVYLLILSTAALLVPAMTLHESRTAKKARRSPKSWGLTLFFAVFFGFLGLHRFYTGHTRSGILYIPSVGGCGIGWLIDIITIISGNFTDKNGHIVHRKSKSEAAHSRSSTKQIKRSTAPTPGFTEYILPGEDENKQPISQNQVPLPHTSGIPVYTPTERLLLDMRKFADREGDIVPAVPFTDYRPTYSSMTPGQLAWYFYWRTQARQGVYLNTDLSYIYLHIFEILNGIGWTDAADGCVMLLRLWSACRDQNPILDNRMSDWIFDFTRSHELEYRVPENAQIRLPHQQAPRDILIGRHADQTPLKLSFELIESLCDYTVRDSSFAKNGYEPLIREVMPRAVALADAALKKQKGRGILALYAPRRTKQQTYYAYRNAFFPAANSAVTVSVTGYSSGKKLRGFITALVRHAENILRSLYKHRGRLRVEDLDPEIGELVEIFLRKEYDPSKPISAPQAPGIDLDFESIEALRRQSDAVRDALEVDAEELPMEEPLMELQPINAPLTENLTSPSESDIPISASSGAEDACESHFDHSVLSDAMRSVLDALSPAHTEALRAITAAEHPADTLQKIADEAFTMPEMIIDEINDMAMPLLDDILIDTYNDEPRILEQYVTELKAALK